MLEYRIHIVLFNRKNESIDLYIKKEHYDLYTEIHGSIAFNSFQIRLAQETSFYYQNPPIITYKAGTTTGVENRNLIHCSITAGTYWIDDFNTKIKEFVLQQRQGWEPPQNKDLKLVIPKDYTFLADNTIFITLGIPKNILKMLR